MKAEQSSAFIYLVFMWFLVFKFTLGKFKTSIANLVDIANDFLDRSGGDRQLEELVGYLSI